MRGSSNSALVLQINRRVRERCRHPDRDGLQGLIGLRDAVRQRLRFVEDRRAERQRQEAEAAQRKRLEEESQENARRAVVQLASVVVLAT